MKREERSADVSCVSTPLSKTPHRHIRNYAGRVQLHSRLSCARASPDVEFCRPVRRPVSQEPCYTYHRNERIDDTDAGSPSTSPSASSTPQSTERAVPQINKSSTNSDAPFPLGAGAAALTHFCFHAIVIELLVLRIRCK